MLNGKNKRQCHSKKDAETLAELLFSPDEQRHASALTRGFIERYHKSLPERPVFPEIDRASHR